MKDLPQGTTHYYRIYRTKDGEVYFPRMLNDGMSNDEYDYDENRFLNDVHYPTEESAKDGFRLLRVKAQELLEYKYTL